MANLWIRGVDQTLYDALIREAEANGRSVEEEQRALMSIPDVGEDADFERVNDRREAPVVFD